VQSKPATTRGHLFITTLNAAALGAEIRTALSAPGIGVVTIDLDAADYLDDEVAPVLRRAGAAAEHAGIQLLLRATRPGPQRWLRRHGLAGGGE
jgi:anti-anti-sigma regulatory factor